MGIAKTPNYDRIKAFVIARDKDTASFEHLKFTLKTMKDLIEEVDKLIAENEKLRKMVK